MKIKILRGDRGKWYHNTDNIGREFGVKEYYEYSLLRFNIKGGYRVDEDDCVITELPESFCVKRCDDEDKWMKYIQWLNKNCGSDFGGGIGNTIVPYYGVNVKFKGWFGNFPFGTEIHIDDIIKHIHFYSEPMVLESEEEFDMSTNEGRLAYARKYYPIGTKYVPLDYKTGDTYPQSTVSRNEPYITNNPYANCYSDIVAGNGFIYVDKFDKWAEIIKKEDTMETQKLSRKGLKEIHSIACSAWKEALEHYGTRNPLEDYIELTQNEVDAMFLACTKEQLPIVSKYLKKDDGSVDVKTLHLRDNHLIAIRQTGEYKHKAFGLNTEYDWILNFDNEGGLCLIPTKKK